MIALGTDGYGRSESRASLRDFFEVDAKHIVLATLTGLLREGKIKAAEVKKAIADLGINSEKADPFCSVSGSALEAASERAAPRAASMERKRCGNRIQTPGAW